MVCAAKPDAGRAILRTSRPQPAMADNELRAPETPEGSRRMTEPLGKAGAGNRIRTGDPQLGKRPQDIAMRPTDTQGPEATQSGGRVTSQPSTENTALPNPFGGLRGGPRAALPVRVIDGGRDRLLNVREVAARLGVSTATVYKLVNGGYLAHVRVANAIRVAPAVLDEFIARGGASS